MDEYHNRLQKERALHSLPIEALTTYLYGGKGKQTLHNLARRLVEEDPILGEPDLSFYDLSRKQMRERTLAKIQHLFSVLNKIEDPDLRLEVFRVAGDLDESLNTRFGVHMGLFGEAIRGQGTDEQIAEWYPKVESGEIYGCYCMTELGTGSYIQSFETTATFEKESDSFVIHTPTLTATKWWVGASAQTATHGIVFARLILNGEDLGVHNFIVQLRDEQFNLCEGVEIGDVGPKRGAEGIDNGWLRFHHVRIPRTQMLQRWARVNSDGEYVQAKMPQLAYGALIGGRVNIVRWGAEKVQKALSISIRYSIVRDQQLVKGQSLMDFQTQQERLIGPLAEAYAYHFAAMKLDDYYHQVLRELEDKDISNLSDAHNLSAGLKGFVSLWAVESMSTCILCMGGHSYSKYSGLPRLLDDYVWLVPAEGDAIVMVQQTARQLMKTLKNLSWFGQPRDKNVRYLKQVWKARWQRVGIGAGEFLNQKELLKACKWLALTTARDAGKHLKTLLKQGIDKKEAWNRCQLDLIQASKAHIGYWVVKNFYEAIEQELPQALGDAADELLPHITRMADLVALRHLREFFDEFVGEGYFHLSRDHAMREQINEIYRDLRPYLAQLVDAFDYSDMSLRSPLGRFDGNIYEEYFKAVNAGEQDIRPDYWKTYLKPLFDQKHRRPGGEDMDTPEAM